MANVPQTAALIVIAQNYAGDVVRQINRTSVLLKLLQPTMREAVGANAAWVPESSGAGAESFAEGATAVNFGSDAQTSATIPLARYWALWNVTGTALMISRSARTPAGNVELWARNMVNGAEKLAKLLNGDLYTGAGGNDLVGLDAAIGSITNTYATIDRTQGANSFWLPGVVADSGAAALTFKTIRDDLASIKVASGYKPDFAMVAPAMYNKMAGMYDPQKQYVFKTDIREVMTAAGSIVLEGGVGAISFDGCVFIEDVSVPANSIYYCNSRYMHMEYGDAEASLPMGAGDEAFMIGGLSDGMDTIPMNIVMEMFAKTGDAQSAALKCYPQLVVERPNAFGRRVNIG